MKRLSTEERARADRVLVVDDEPVIQELVREVMYDHVTIAAGSLAEARAIVESGQEFEVALVDKNLPDGSGIDLVRWLRKARPDTEALIITGYPSMDSALEAISIGAIDYLVKPMRDINELRLRIGNACHIVRQHRSEAALISALRDSEERYRELFEATPDAVLVLDSETRDVVDANSAAERLYGRRRGELVGMRGAALTAREPAPVVRDGTVLRRELRADGTTVPVEVTTGVARHGARALAVEVVRDVSEREARDLLEKRLARSSRLEALGRLAAGVAHDFNNLLCVIMTSAEFAGDAMRDGGLPAGDLDQIHQAVTSAASLTRQLLAFSGRQFARPQVIDLNARVELVVRMLERTLGARVKVALDLAPEPILVNIDPGQLEQVLTNLAVNARDAMPGGGTLTIVTRAEGGGAQIRMRDTGTGIAPHVLPEIFEPFFTTKGPEKGTGLGLATVREVVQRCGGRVGATSELGAGTTFELWLPKATGDSPQATAALPQTVVGGRGEDVLLIEDDPRVRDAARRVLAGAGYAVHEAASGEDALARVERGQHVDVVVADLELPGISGVECVRRLAASASLKIVYTSGLASDPRGGERGQAFLPKPYAPDDLLRTVRKALDV